MHHLPHAGKPVSPAIEPARTAIGRTTLSRPVALVLNSGLLSSDKSFLDFGCGRGDDVRGLHQLGFNAAGWDPFHRPDGSLKPADVVNLGYVLNVIADQTERAQALQRAWSLATRVLVVAARL